LRRRVAALRRTFERREPFRDFKVRLRHAPDALLQRHFVRLDQQARRLDLPEPLRLLRVLLRHEPASVRSFEGCRRKASCAPAHFPKALGLCEAVACAST
jgi:hypothetical protein